MPSASSFNFLAFYRPTRAAMLTGGPTAHERDAISEHIEYLASLQARGIVWFAGRTQVQDDRTRGICIFKADSDKAAHALIDADPCVSRGVMIAEVFPFRVAVPAP